MASFEVFFLLNRLSLLQEEDEDVFLTIYLLNCIVLYIHNSLQDICNVAEFFTG